MIEQLEEAGVEPDFYYLPFGTGGIFTATLFTLRALGSAARVRGVSVNRDLAECEQFLDRWWEGIGDLLDIDEPLDKGDYSITDRFIGRAYGDPAPALHAIITLAETEGVLVDPVYSGKVLSGLIHHAGDGTILAGSTVAMIHSGGTPALFAYHEAIAAHLEEQRDIRLD
jgi:D-cysteine desulfhydrase